MKHVTAPFSKQTGTTTSKAYSDNPPSRGNSTWTEKFTLMLLFLFVSQVGIVAQTCDLPIAATQMENISTCSTTQSISGQSGDVFELTINPANNYTFTICYDGTPPNGNQFPHADLWNDISGVGVFLESTGNPVSNCTSVSYTALDDCMNEDALIYLATFDHQCGSNWNDIEITVACEGCSIMCNDPRFIAATYSGCSANAFTVDLPTVSGSCEGNVIAPMSNAELMPFTSRNIDGSIAVAAGAPTGTHTITFTVEDCAGVATTCEQVIIIEPILACDDVVNVTLSRFCELQVTPSMLLEAECADDSQYTVNILGQTDDIITEPGLYEVQIMYTPDMANTASGNFCWGFINAEDKSGPTCSIENNQINISCGESFDSGTPVFDDCSGIDENSINLVTLNFGDCGDLSFPFTVSSSLTIPAPDPTDQAVIDFTAPIDAVTDMRPKFVVDRVIVNLYSASDVNGLSSDACPQFIYIWRPSTVNQPRTSVTIECGSSIDQETLAALDPQNVPHYVNVKFDAAADTSADNDLEFTPLDDNNNPQFLPITDTNNGVCKFNVSSTDELLSETCGMTEKYIREFTVIDWCDGSFVTGLENFRQIIVIEDTTAPEFDCVAETAEGGSFENPFVLNTTASASAACGFEGLLTPPTATDFCSSPLTFSANIFTSGQSGTGYILVTQVQDLSNNIALEFRDYRVDFVATDACGNISEPCSVFYDIRDNTAPVAICDQFTTVSLTNATNGAASICADNLDSGSSDNCGIATRMIKRMDRDDDFSSCLDVDCADAGQQVMVMLRVTDEAGNENTCIVTVSVEDKSGPSVVCPADITVNCMESTDQSVTGFIELNTTTPSGNNGYAVDNCGVNFADITAESGDIDCGQGLIERTFTVFTSNGVTTCTQTITVEPDFNFFVTFPEDVTIEGCANMVNIDMVGEPIISGVTCAEVGISSEDQTFVIQSGACNRITRTYIIKNTCVDVNEATATAGGIAVEGDALKFQDDGDGYFRYTQNIDIIDNTAPVITSTAPIFFDTFNDDCTGNVAVNIEATDNCSDNLTYSWSVDIFNNGTNDEFGSNATISGVFPVGVHAAKVSVSDGCGNTSTSEFDITISDRKNPTPFCNNVNTVIMNGDARSVQIWASDLIKQESISDNCTNNEDIIVSVSLATNPNPSVAPSATEVTITCDDLVRDGNGNALPTTFDIQVFVQDENGNFDFCVVEVEVIDTENDCGTTATASAQISGRIFNENDEDVEEVTVQVANTSQDMTPYVTQTDGSFLFPDLDMNDDYSVEPAKNINVTNGISTFDLVLLTRHILSLQTLDSPYKILAADVNLDRTLDIRDLLEMRQLILFNIQEFSSEKSWLFVDANYQFANPENPLGENIPHVIDINNLASDVSANFVGVKLGDLDNTSVANRLLDVDTRSFDPVATIAIENQELESGQEVSIPFHMTDFTSMSAMQFTIEFDPARLEFAGFKEGALELKGSNFGFTMLDEGAITFSWNTFSGNTIAVADNDLFELNFIAKTATDIATELTVNSKHTIAEAYNEGGKYNVELNILSEDGASLNAAAFELYQNQPNPFKVNTNIGFNLPQASAATLRIMDVSGKELRVIKDNFVRGYNEINIDLSELDANGVLYYQLETASHTATRKMIVIK